MHGQAADFIRHCLLVLPPRRRVLEIGSRNVNGTVRPLFRDAALYLGLDLRKGRGVDVVGDGGSWAPPGGTEPFDTVVCCEVLEHAANARRIVRNAHALLGPSGVFLMTCAGPGRGEHSAEDGNALREGEYYANVTVEEFAQWARPFDSLAVRRLDLDLQALCLKGVVR